MRWRLTAVLGAALGVIGLAAVAFPGLTTMLPTDMTFVTLLGVVLLLGAVSEIQRRRSTPVEYAETPDTELAIELPTPGDDFDRRLERFRFTRFDELKRYRIRDRVGEVATKTIRRREQCSEDAAERALSEGTWTDDPFAAALFTRGRPEAELSARLRELFSGELPFKQRTIRAIDAVYRLAEGEDD